MRILRLCIGLGCLLIFAICFVGYRVGEVVSTYTPCFSPDGKSVLFTTTFERKSSHAGWSKIYRVNTDGTGLTCFANSGYCDPCKWYMDYRCTLQYSPDGKCIVCAEDAKDWYSIRLLTSAGKTEQRMTGDNNDIIHHAWLPDSKGIVLVDKQQDSPKFRFMSITNPRTALGDISNSYSGKAFWMVYDVVAGRSPHDTLRYRICKQRIDGSNSEPVLLTDGLHFDHGPKLSADGKRILFESDRLPRGIWVVDTDGKNLKCVHADAQAALPTWSPDGKKIAFVRYPKHPTEGGSDIWLVDADGKNPHRLTNLYAYHIQVMVMHLLYLALGLTVAVWGTRRVLHTRRKRALLT